MSRTLHFRTSSLLIVAFFLVLIGCATREDEQQPIAGDDAQVALGPPRASGIERVPVPAAAERLSGGGDGSERTQDVYRVPGSTFDHVEAWYLDYMPPGQDFRGWVWCEPPRGASFAQRIYFRDGTQEILTVVITADDPPNILISREDGASC